MVTKVLTHQMPGLHKVWKHPKNFHLLFEPLMKNEKHSYSVGQCILDSTASYITPIMKNVKQGQLQAKATVIFLFY